jgi:hypothetical protein
MLIAKVGINPPVRQDVIFNLQCFFRLEVLYILLVVRNLNCKYNRGDHTR